MRTELYPEIEIYKEHMIPVSDLHTIYVEESGNPLGHPVVVLHGGPGGASSPANRQFFDPEFYRIIQFDQRGCGKSTPFASLEENTTHDLVADMEKIRTALGIEKWLVFGGSWGTTLALHYTIAHRERVVGLMLRGIFLGRQSDVDWLYQDGASHFYPENFEKFKAPIPVEEQGELVNAYYKRLTSEDESICLEEARAWAEWEHGLVKLIPYDPIVWDEAGIRGALTIARMECHFFYHHCFVEDDNYILNRAEAFKGIPMHIVHGRYDVDSLPSAAFELAQAVDGAELIFAQAAGHTAMEPATMEALVGFSEKCKNYFK